MTRDPQLPALSRAITDAGGVPFAATRVEGVGGGCIHRALRVEGGTGTSARTLFVKSNDRDREPMFEAEEDGLRALREGGAVRVPAVVGRGRDDASAWLVLEWLELAPLGARAAGGLGIALAAQHRVSFPQFGWRRDNFIGATPQENARGDDWHAFFRDRRLHPQLRLAARNRLPSRMIDRGERLLADCGAYFAGHAPEASLLHGDLWGGNAAQLADGTPVLFDPAVYAGDREADIAMTQLFGGFPPDFIAAYDEAWAPAPGRRERRDLYNLYHVLNHANLFAGGYVRQAEESIGRLVAAIG